MKIPTFSEYIGAVIKKFLGESCAMGVWRVVGSQETMCEAATPAPEDAIQPLVGRGEEKDLIVRRWEQSKAGQVVLINGEADTGKAALVDRLRAHVQQERLTRVAARSSPYHTNGALYPGIAQYSGRYGLPGTIRPKSNSPNWSRPSRR